MCLISSVQWLVKNITVFCKRYQLQGSILMCDFHEQYKSCVWLSFEIHFVHLECFCRPFLQKKKIGPTWQTVLAGWSADPVPGRVKCQLTRSQAECHVSWPCPRQSIMSADPVPGRVSCQLSGSSGHRWLTHTSVPHRIAEGTSAPPPPTHGMTGWRSDFIGDAITGTYREQ